jgi:hypothetical protein
MNSCLILIVVTVAYGAECNGFADRCAIAHGAHGCECRPFDPNMTNVPFCVGEKLECNRNNGRCYFCPEGEFTCDCDESCADDQLVCVRGHCAVGEITTTHGGANQTCFVGTVSYTRCESTTLFCDAANTCVRCPATARPLGCGCQNGADCASGLMCDAPSGVCAPCAPDCAGNCTRTDPQVAAAVQEAAIALSVTLVLLVVIGLVAGFVVHRRRRTTMV